MGHGVSGFSDSSYPLEPITHYRFPIPYPSVSQGLGVTVTLVV
jgi:hypothetical protein